MAHLMTSRNVLRVFRMIWHAHVVQRPQDANDKPMRREMFSNLVDALARGGRISERVAFNVTLPVQFNNFGAASFLGADAVDESETAPAVFNAAPEQPRTTA